MPVLGPSIGIFYFTHLMGFAVNGDSLYTYATLISIYIADIGPISDLLSRYSNKILLNQMNYFLRVQS